MTDAEVIQLVDERIAQLSRVRVPELPDYALTGDQISLLDRLPIWRESDDTTVQTSLQYLKAFLINSSEEVVTPTLMGSVFIATADDFEDNTPFFNIPSIAGKEFVLRPAGYRALKIGVEYDILSSGGFKLLTRNITKGEEFEIELINDSIPVGPGPSGSGGTLFSGIAQIAATQTLNAANHLTKLIQLRPAATGMVTSLAKIEDVPENSLWWIDASISQYESKVSSTAGQYLYINGSSVTEISVRPGEFLIALRGDDGYYVIDYSRSITEVAKHVMWGYYVDGDEIELNGGVYSKVLYGRFYNTAKTKFALSWCTQAQWDTATETVSGIVYEYPYRGFFVDIDADTFRVPDYAETAIRTLKTRSSGISETPRHSNAVGSFQMDELKEHDHDMGFNTFVQSGSSTPCFAQVDSTDPAKKKGKTWKTGGYETRMKNIGLKAKMKV